MFHLRQSGWLLASEHEANEAAKAAEEQKAARKSASTRKASEE
jgi:hypothetical protein